MLECLVKTTPLHYRTPSPQTAHTCPKHAFSSSVDIPTCMSQGSCQCILRCLREEVPQLLYCTLKRNACNMSGMASYNPSTKHFSLPKVAPSLPVLLPTRLSSRNCWMPLACWPLWLKKKKTWINHHQKYSLSLALRWWKGRKVGRLGRGDWGAGSELVGKNILNWCSKKKNQSTVLKKKSRHWSEKKALVWNCTACPLESYWCVFRGDIIVTIFVRAYSYSYLSTCIEEPPPHWSWWARIWAIAINCWQVTQFTWGEWSFSWRNLDGYQLVLIQTMQWKMDF